MRLCDAQFIQDRHVALTISLSQLALHPPFDIPVRLSVPNEYYSHRILHS